MEYKFIGSQITLKNEKYWILSGELNKFTLMQLDDIIQDMENVFDGKYSSSSFSGDVVFTIEYNKDIAKIEYYDEFVGDEPTVEVYNMLKIFRKKLSE